MTHLHLAHPARPDGPAAHAPAPAPSSTARRVAGAALYLPAVVLLLVLGGWGWRGFCATVAAVGTFEFLRVASRWRVELWLTVAVAAAIPCWVGARPASAPLGILGMVGVLTLLLWTAQVIAPAPGGHDRVAESLSALVVCAGGMACVEAVRERPDGLRWAALLLALTWGNDAAAYFAGLAFGKTPLAPAVSPKKTREGWMGGALGSATLALAARLLLHESGGRLFALAAICSVVGPLGDLAKSVLKRAQGVKDFGALIPGHGGVLDRFDAVLFNAPLLLALLRWT